MTIPKEYLKKFRHVASETCNLLDKHGGSACLIGSLDKDGQNLIFSIIGNADDAIRPALTSLILEHPDVADKVMMAMAAAIHDAMRISNAVMTEKAGKEVH